MDYEKKYKEANDKVAARFGTNVAKEIFTDLYESEDEKIRKELIEHVKDQQSSFISAPDCRDKYEEEENNKYNSWLVWLEKQGKQKPILDFNADDWYVSKVDGKIHNIYHSVDKVEPKFKVGDRITKSSKKSCPVHSSIDDTICEVTEVHDTCYILNTKEGRIQEPFEWQDHYELVNPAWSEEDEVMIKVFDSIIRYIVEVVDKDALERFGTNREELFSWLKSLRSQSKQEWSEEDEEYINDLIGVFDGQQYQAHSDEEIVKWLKSIRLPYNKEWDENDEEMLRSIIATCELAEQDRDSSPARHLLEMQLNWLKSLKQRIGGK